MPSCNSLHVLIRSNIIPQFVFILQAKRYFGVHDILSDYILVDIVAIPRRVKKYK